MDACPIHLYLNIFWDKENDDMGKIVDLTGEKFGRLTVIKLHRLNKRNKAI